MEPYQVHRLKFFLTQFFTNPMYLTIMIAVVVLVGLVVYKRLKQSR